MKARFKQVAERINAMSLRERVLIFLMLAAALLAVVINLALDPLAAQRKSLADRLAEHQAQLQALHAQSQALAETLKQDPDAANRARLAELSERRSALQAEFAALEQGLVAAGQMPQLLRDLLGRHPNLSLVGIKTLPPRALDGEAAQTDKNAAVYVHGVELTVEGRYPDLVAYLADLERSRWRMYWGGAQLAVQQYPLSHLTVTLYTLSLDKTWLSV